jgi:hypothetical protein
MSYDKKIQMLHSFKIFFEIVREKMIKKFIKLLSVKKLKFYFQSFLSLSCVTVMAQSVVQIPSLSGNWELKVPINFYCKIESRLGYFRSDRGWGPLRFPIDQEVDFTFKLKKWENLTKEELEICNLDEDKISKIERERNWKMCGITSYPSVSTKIYPSICTPQKAKDGRVTLKCDEGKRVDVDDAVIMESSGDFSFVLRGVNAVDLSRCNRIQ